MKIKVKISRNLKIGDIGSIFSVKKVDNGTKPVIIKTELFLLSKNLITFSKNGL